MLLKETVSCSTKLVQRCRIWVITSFWAVWPDVRSSPISDRDSDLPGRRYGQKRHFAPRKKRASSLLNERHYPDQRRKLSFALRSKVLAPCCLAILMAVRNEASALRFWPCGERANSSPCSRWSSALVEAFAACLGQRDPVLHRFHSLGVVPGLHVRFRQQSEQISTRNDAIACACNVAIACVSATNPRSGSPFSAAHHPTTPVLHALGMRKIVLRRHLACSLRHVAAPARIRRPELAPLPTRNRASAPARTDHRDSWPQRRRARPSRARCSSPASASDSAVKLRAQALASWLP